MNLQDQPAATRRQIQGNDNFQRTNEYQLRRTTRYTRNNQGEASSEQQ